MKEKLKVPLSERDHSQGRNSAPIELIQYGDYQCPFCSHADIVIKRLQNHFKTDLLYVFRNFPLAKIHPWAFDAAKAAEAADKQGKFWHMHDVLFENQEDLDPSSLLAYARAINLNLDYFTSDFNSFKTTEKIMSDFYGGSRSGVTGTPTFFINGFKYDGDWSYESLLGALKALTTRVS